MKIKLLSVIISAALIFGMLAGCGGGEQRDSGKVSIVATVFPQYDFARQIAGDRAEITLLLKPGMEAHSYEPTPKDIIKIAHCDLFLNVGGESESWLDSVVESVENNDMHIVSAMSCVENIEEEHVEGMTEKGHSHEHDEDCEDEHDHDHEHEHSEEEEDEHAEYDEHVWTSPVNSIEIVNKIAQDLCEIDPENAEYYSANAAEYIAQLTELDGKFREIAANSSRNTLVFGDRFPLLYFVKEYDINYYAAFPGCASETEPSAATVAFMIDKVKSEDIPVVFYIELSNHKVADAIAECTGAKSMLFNTCHNISADDFEAGETYLSLMTANLEVLEEALN